MFSFTRSRSRLRVENSRSSSRPKTGRLRNPGVEDLDPQHWIILVTYLRISPFSEQTVLQTVPNYLYREYVSWSLYLTRHRQLT